METCSTESQSQRIIAGQEFGEIYSCPGQGCTWTALLSSLPLLMVPCALIEMLPKLSSTAHNVFANVNVCWGRGSSIVQTGEGSSLSGGSRDSWWRLNVVLQRSGVIKYILPPHSGRLKALRGPAVEKPVLLCLI